MTAPAAVGEINAQIASVQARIALVTYRTSTAVPSPTSSAASSTMFANAMTSATAPTEPTAVAGSGSVTGQAVVADATKYLGIPYVWGGESTSGIDCSGLVQKTFGDLGVTLPRTAAEQSHQGTAVSSLAQAQPGDLLFFGSPAYHVAIYAGNNKLIESPEPGKTVHVTDVYQTPTSIRRIVAGTSATQPTSATGGLTSAQLTSTGMTDKVAGYAAQFAAAERTYNLPTGMLAAVAQQESGGNASAVSPSGAEGLMQLMPSTAAGLGVNAFDPSQAISAAAKILSGNLTRFHDSVPLALAAYNAGAGAVAQ
jgi:cell wall-associated NlpC family hydrolase